MFPFQLFQVKTSISFTYSFFSSAVTKFKTWFMCFLLSLVGVQIWILTVNCYLMVRLILSLGLGGLQTFNRSDSCDVFAIVMFSHKRSFKKCDLSHLSVRTHAGCSPMQTAGSHDLIMVAGVSLHQRGQTHSNLKQRRKAASFHRCTHSPISCLQFTR